MITTPQLVVELIKTLKALGVRYAIGGSFASSAWGQPRQTHDLDIGVQLDSFQAAELLQTVQGVFMVSELEVADALSSSDPHRSFQLLHIEETFKVDVFVLHPTEYSAETLARARRYPIAPDVQASFLAPEDVVIMKLRWFVLGNRVSDRQWNDIVNVLEVQAGQVDEAYLKKWALHFGVDDLLVEAISQATL